MGARPLGATARRRLRVGWRAVGRLMAALRHCWWLAAPVILAGCVREVAAPPATSAVVVQQPAQTIVAPGPPPAPRAELVPTPPPGAGPVVWQPGHWRLSGNTWAWEPGQYVPPPPGQTTWVPGRWMRQSTGTWSWVEGHWA
jgi:hypothetical protein